MLLDASASDTPGCADPEYRFREGMLVLLDWSPSSSYGPIVPAATTTYSVDVRCGDCEATASAELEIADLPLAVAGEDVLVCAGDELELDGEGSGGGGCPGTLFYEWWEGVTLVHAGPDPRWSPATDAIGTRVYTLVVSCAELPDCSAADVVEVRVEPCVLAVEFRSFGAALSRERGEPVVPLARSRPLQEPPKRCAPGRASP